jgi:hypothetical protein
MIQPVAKKHYMTRVQLAELDAGNNTPSATRADARAAAAAVPTPTWLVVVAWAAVGIPIAWGVWVTVQKASAIFMAP